MIRNRAGRKGPFSWINCTGLIQQVVAPCSDNSVLTMVPGTITWAVTWCYIDELDGEARELALALREEWRRYRYGEEET